MAKVVLAVASLALAVLFVFHGLIPDSNGAISLVEDVLPWFGILIVVFGLFALLRGPRRARLAVFALAVAAIAWCVQFVPALVPQQVSGTAQLTIVSENVDAGNADPTATMKRLAARHPDVIALQELTAASRDAADAVLGAAYPHSYVVGTVGVWSRFGLSDGEPLALGLAWKRALRVDVDAPWGSLRLYELHAASVRPGEFVDRDAMLGHLKDALAGDDARHLVVVGDFNAASSDRHFRALLSQAKEARPTAFGFGFTWPAGFPLARLDHVLQRGLTVTSSSVLAPNGSDHRGVSVGLRPAG